MYISLSSLKSFQIIFRGKGTRERTPMAMPTERSIPIPVAIPLAIHEFGLPRIKSAWTLFYCTGLLELKLWARWCNGVHVGWRKNTIKITGKNNILLILYILFLSGLEQSETFVLTPDCCLSLLYLSDRVELSTGRVWAFSFQWFILLLLCTVEIFGQVALLCFGNTALCKGNEVVHFYTKNVSYYYTNII